MAESKRFVREVMLSWSHREVGAALDAAEAAFALNPDDFHTGAVHARAILVAGADLVCGGDFVDPSRYCDLVIRAGTHAGPHQMLFDPSKMTLMLRLVGAAPMRWTCRVPRCIARPYDSCDHRFSGHATG